jgi:hypothetical protein
MPNANAESRCRRQRDAARQRACANRGLLHRSRPPQLLVLRQNVFWSQCWRRLNFGQLMFDCANDDEGDQSYDKAYAPVLLADMYENAFAKMENGVPLRTGEWAHRWMMCEPSFSINAIRNQRCKKKRERERMQAGVPGLRLLRALRPAQATRWQWQPRWNQKTMEKCNNEEYATTENRPPRGPGVHSFYVKL